MHARGRPHVDDIVGGEDGLLVVLDHQHGVAEVAQALEAGQEAGVVALVQADGWFVQHIEHPGQARADLAGQADALAFAARQRAGAARQGQVVEAHVHQEAQAVVDLLQDALGDLHLLVAQTVLQPDEPVARVLDRQQGGLADRGAGDLHRQGLGLQAQAVAGIARRLGLVAAELLAHPGAVGLAPAALEVGQHAFEGLVDLVLAGVVVVAELDLLGARSVQDHQPRGVRQLVPGHVHREAVVPRQGLQGLGVERRGALGPRADGALVQALVLVGDDEVGVERQLVAEAVAHRAGAERVVEREQARLDLGDGEARDGAGELLGEQHAPRPALAFGHVRPFGHGDAVGQAQRGLQAVGQALFQPRLGDDAVHHHVDVVLDLLLERRHVLDGVELAVHLQALEALALQVGDLLAVLALAPADHRGQQEQARALGQGHDLVDHLADGLALDRQAGGRRIGHAHPRPQQAHVVVDLGDGADRRARVLRRGLLFDGDGRRQALDQVHVRLAHQLQELAGVGRQALHIAALALGVDGVERQRALARARQPRQHHQLLARDVDADVLQIVFARAAHADEAMRIGHAGLSGTPARGGAGQRQYVGPIPPFSARTYHELEALPPGC